MKTTRYDLTTKKKGINLTAAVEDVLVGDTATGALRIFEAALLACAIAMGFALAVYVFKGGEVL